MAQTARNSTTTEAQESKDTGEGIERGVIADSDTSPNDRTLSAASSSVAEGVAEDSVPPKALAELAPGDRIHINDDPTTYTVQYPFGGRLSSASSEVQVTRDSDGRIFTLLTTTVEREDGLTTAVKLVNPSEIRCGSVEFAEDETVVTEVIRYGRGNPAKGPGRDMGVLVPGESGGGSDARGMERGPTLDPGGARSRRARHFHGLRVLD